MIKIAYRNEIGIINHLPVEVVNVVSEITTILDDNYGEERNANDYGGYILVVENEDDVSKLNDEIGIDITTAIPEYVDLIRCSNGGEYTNSLILCNNDFGISLIIPLSLTAKNLLDYMEE
ncbi:hypothetical protein [Clostridium drakei]|uniref:Uncharacterized protein n=1 Tax=Clostridium drakei TaxID=332101 RepID=A0A2U8DK18_9CLOT|nr:hypothetical protein [Clostridium drakei]AWI03120.1 hypothetical protein B9W14_00890 [Clostridium drakei]